MQTDGYEYAIRVHIKLEFFNENSVEDKEDREGNTFIGKYHSYCFCFVLLLLCLSFHYVL